MKRPIRAVCFDMDGLLFNTEDLFDEVGEELLQRRHRRPDAELVKRMMGLQADRALQLLIDHYQLDDTVPALQQETEELFAALLPSRLAPMPGAVEILEHLSACGRRPVALTTSSGRQQVTRIMDLCDLRPHFHFELTAEDIVQSKPHPEIYLTAAARFGVTPGETLVFEDSENGCRAGVAAGAHVVAVPSKHAALHSYEGAALVVEDLHDPRIFSLLDPPEGSESTPL